MVDQNRQTSSVPTKKTSEREIKRIFDRYYTNPISYTSNEVDAVIGFFQKRGFDQVAAVNTAVVLLQQAKTDGIEVWKLLDTLGGQTDVQLSNVVATILNLNRTKVSTLGFKVQVESTKLEQRNIVL